MKTFEFIVETGKSDPYGVQVVPDGIVFENPVRVRKNWGKTLGRCELYHEDGVLKAKAELPEEVIGLYPAISFTVLHSSWDDHGNRIISRALLGDVSLSQEPNVDPEIPALQP